MNLKSQTSPLSLCLHQPVNCMMLKHNPLSWQTCSLSAVGDPNILSSGLSPMVLLNFSVSLGKKAAPHSPQLLCLLFAPTGCRARVKQVPGLSPCLVLLATVMQTA